jgi:hypothetical protein
VAASLATAAQCPLGTNVTLYLSFPNPAACTAAGVGLAGIGASFATTCATTNCNAPPPASGAGRAGALAAGVAALAAALL